MEWLTNLLEELKDVMGMVEYLCEWVQETTNPVHAKYLGVLFLVAIAMIVAWRSSELFKNGRPKKED